MTVQRTVRVDAIVGLGIDWTSASSITIKTGECLNDTFKVFMPEVTTPIVVDITASGINGLDTGSEAANTWYSVWFVAGATGAGGLLSLSETSPTLPSGYDSVKRRVGWIRNEAADIRFFHQLVFGSSRLYNWDDSDRVATRIADNLNNTTMTAASAATWMPPTSETGYFLAGSFVDLTTAFVFIYINRGGTSQASPAFRVPADTSSTGSADLGGIIALLGTNTSQEVQARSLTTSGLASYTINALGFLDQLEID